MIWNVYKGNWLIGIVNELNETKAKAAAVLFYNYDKVIVREANLDGSHQGECKRALREWRLKKEKKAREALLQ